MYKCEWCGKRFKDGGVGGGFFSPDKYCCKKCEQEANESSNKSSNSNNSGGSQSSYAGKSCYWCGKDFDGKGVCLSSTTGDFWKKVTKRRDYCCKRCLNESGDSVDDLGDADIIIKSKSKSTSKGGGGFVLVVIALFLIWWTCKSFFDESSDEAVPPVNTKETLEQKAAEPATRPAQPAPSAPVENAEEKLREREAQRILEEERRILEEERRIAEAQREYQKVIQELDAQNNNNYFEQPANDPSRRPTREEKRLQRQERREEKQRQRQEKNRRN